jgi:head-tail adaptor
MLNRSPIPSGRRAYYRVTVQNPSPPRIVDGDAVADPWITATPPDWYVFVTPAVTADQERAKATGVLTQLSSMLTGPYRPDVTTASRLISPDGRALSVVAVEDYGERRRELVVGVSEVAPT